MRTAGQKLVDFYKTQLGQDVLETLPLAAASAGYQGLFTDMSPEEIAMSTGVGVGAAFAGRPLFGRLGQAIGNRVINKQSPNIGREVLEQMQRDPMFGDVMKAKLAPYVNQSPAGQLGQIFGRGYGDNVLQGAVAFAAPELMPGEE
jgi:hypothetical protein